MRKKFFCFFFAVLIAQLWITSGNCHAADGYSRDCSSLRDTTEVRDSNYIPLPLRFRKNRFTPQPISSYLALPEALKKRLRQLSQKRPLALDDYIQNQSATAQSANFWITGTGRMTNGMLALENYNTNTYNFYLGSSAPQSNVGYGGCMSVVEGIRQAVGWEGSWTGQLIKMSYANSTSTPWNSKVIGQQIVVDGYNNGAATGLHVKAWNSQNNTDATALFVERGYSYFGGDAGFAPGMGIQLGSSVFNGGSVLLGDKNGSRNTIEITPPTTYSGIQMNYDGYFQGHALNVSGSGTYMAGTAVNVDLTNNYCCAQQVGYNASIHKIYSNVYGENALALGYAANIVGDGGSTPVGYRAIVTSSTTQPAYGISINTTNSGGGDAYAIYALAGKTFLADIPNATNNANKFIVSDGGIIKYRTAAQLLSDIGAGAGSNTSTTWALGGNAGTSPSQDFIGTSDNQPVIFKTNSAEAFRITSNGQLAIGPADPKNYRLAVNGDAIFTKIKVKLQNQWPDYVFNAGYRLPTLKEVEQYIRTHQYLPEMPSEKEVAEKGIDMEEIQVKLLKKVEELTLYLIEANKKIEKLESKVTELETNKVNK